MQSYPSPSANAGDAGQQPFYSSASNQQQSGPQNSNDIQIQLAGLTPIMHAGGAIPDGRDPGAQDQGEMNHYAQQASHAHVQPMHSPIDQLGASYGTPEGSMAQKQRSKSSRACDACRHKKIKCNPSDDPNDDQCKSCRRASALCQFSRTPLKRGPSKGYIKELADRVHSLENQIHPSPGGNLPQYFSHSASPAQGRASEDFSPESVAKRRRISTAPGEGQGVRNFLASQPSGWVPQEHSRHVHQLSSAFTSPQLPVSTPIPRDLTYSPSNLQTIPHSLQAIDLKHASETLTQQTGSSHTISMEVYDLDDGVLDRYYLTIQPTYPLLPEDRTKLRLRLSVIPAALKSAFSECIHAAVRSFPTNNQSPLMLPTTARKGAYYIWNSGIVASRSVAENVVYLQCLLLLAIEAENLFISNPTEMTLNRSGWFTFAVGLAIQMKIQLHQPRIEADIDSDDHILRKLWWNLVVMDRCTALTVSTQYLISEEAIAIRFQDLSIIGEGLWNMSRLAITLGHYSLLDSTPDLHLDRPGGPKWAAAFGFALDRCRDTFPSNFWPDSSDFKPVYLMLYWHIKILASVESDLTPTAFLKIVSSAQASMAKTPNFISPLKYQCLMLILVALIDLRGYDETKDISDEILASFLDAHPIPHWDNLIDGLIEKHNKSQPLNSERLRQLANLATTAKDDQEVINTDRDSQLNSTKTTPAVQLPKYVFIKDVLRRGTLSPLSEQTI